MSSDQEQLPFDDQAIQEDTDNEENLLLLGEAEQPEDSSVAGSLNDEDSENEAPPGQELEDAAVDRGKDREELLEENVVDGSKQTDENVAKSVPEIPTPKAKPKAKKSAEEVVRVPGRSLLPFATVQRIIKADVEIPIVAREATFLISVATEEFIMRLCEAGLDVAEKENRTTVRYEDIATVVRRADEFLFMEEILPWTSLDPLPKRAKLKATTDALIKPVKKATVLDRFMGSKQGDTEDAGDDVAMNEDGTMYAAGVSDNVEDDFE
ncbi:hypothetical protein CPB83DRAFT_756459 [Crepidotus variabilis]|uniref:Transcription factor CBF/NF-Y/archaeal histone domain-containing protein n=1 Tax=Crepidotus variabilis TaxID=179855 RepID=A0A9P6JUP0_9AGAR|nr:hypothetical protein CPB83DRAFT_756459 [Crepidotus variabilis]